MRWERLFADLEAQWDTLAWQDTVGQAAELTRAEWAQVSLADRLRGARGRELRLHLVWGHCLEARVRAVGRTWLGVDVAGGDSVLLPLQSLDAVEGELGAAVAEPAGAARGMTAVLRGVARSRAHVDVVGRRGTVIAEGTIDRVGADHLELASHARDEGRRRRAVRGGVVVPLAAVGLVRSAGRLG